MTLVLSRCDVARLLTLDECIGAVEAAFRLHGERRIAPPGILGTHVAGGGFHIKTAILPLARDYFAAKVNGNFPANGQHGDGAAGRGCGSIGLRESDSGWNRLSHDVESRSDRDCLTTPRLRPYSSCDTVFGVPLEPTLLVTRASGRPASRGGLGPSSRKPPRR